MALALARMLDTSVEVPVQDTLAGWSAAAVIGIGVLQTMLIFGLLIKMSKMPGHDAGGLWPVWIPEHYSERTSAYPFDPYSFSHFAHGTLGFTFAYLAGNHNN